MRRISSDAKQFINWTRLQICQIAEEAQYYKSKFEAGETGELMESYNSMLAALGIGLGKVIGNEIAAVCNEFGVENTSEERTAFPYDPNLPDSIEQYACELVRDVCMAYDVPSVEIGDELEEWLNDLWNFHADLRDGNN